MFIKGSYCDFEYLHSRLQERFGVSFDEVDLSRELIQTTISESQYTMGFSHFILVPEQGVIIEFGDRLNHYSSDNKANILENNQLTESEVPGYSLVHVQDVNMLTRTLIKAKFDNSSLSENVSIVVGEVNISQSVAWEKADDDDDYAQYYEEPDPRPNYLLKNQLRVFLFSANTKNRHFFTNEETGEQRAVILFNLIDIEFNLSTLPPSLAAIAQDKPKTSEKSLNGKQQLRESFLKGWLYGGGLSVGHTFQQRKQLDVWNELKEGDSKLFPHKDKAEGTVAKFFSDAKLCSFDSGRKRKLDK